MVGVGLEAAAFRAVLIRPVLPVCSLVVVVETSCSCLSTVVKVYRSVWVNLGLAEWAPLASRFQRDRVWEEAIQCTAARWLVVSGWSHSRPPLRTRLSVRGRGAQVWLLSPAHRCWPGPTIPVQWSWVGVKVGGKACCAPRVRGSWRPNLGLGGLFLRNVSTQQPVLYSVHEHVPRSLVSLAPRSMHMAAVHQSCEPDKLFSAWACCYTSWSQIACPGAWIYYTCGRDLRPSRRSCE